MRTEWLGSRTFVDRGGTFTDVVTLLPDGQVLARKVRSNEAVVGRLAEGKLCFGTTVATNALLEGRSVPTLLVVNEGFADLVSIGDMTRPSLFDPDADWPAPLCSRVAVVEGRMDGEGRELEPVGAVGISATGVASVAIALLNSPANPAHELAVAAMFSAAIPVSLGHRLSQELGYLARIETTLLDAAVSPVLFAAMQADEIPGGAVAIRSDGSLCDASKLRAPDAVLSGPAGGVLAVAEVVRLAGLAGAAGLDMGGTSTDVCLVDAQGPRRRSGEWRVGGLRLRRPALEVETIAAGGGSILGRDAVGYTVGPESAGAFPGPQVYGKGGPPTLTDASIQEGLFSIDTLGLDVDVSCISLPGPATAYVELAREKMAAAVRRLALARGQALADWGLVAFGGAAGQHACAVAEKLGMKTVVVHALASVMSAWGQSLAIPEEESVRAVRGPVASVWPDVEKAWASLATALPSGGNDEYSVDLRYVGTSTALTVVASTGLLALDAHAAEHRRIFGFYRPDFGGGSQFGAAATPMANGAGGGQGCLARWRRLADGRAGKNRAFGHDGGDSGGLGGHPRRRILAD